MYKVYLNDKVIESKLLPQSCTGAPLPLVIRDELNTFIAYHNNLDGDSDVESITIVNFHSCLAILFGPPNDETFFSHPLYNLGLRSYSFSIVENSSWIEEYRKMNSIHPYHSDQRYMNLNHYILSFHDSLFECIAENLDYKIIEGTMSDAFLEIGKCMKYEL